jgi:hypothetical protein
MDDYQGADSPDHRDAKALANKMRRSYKDFLRERGVTRPGVDPGRPGLRTSDHKFL